MFITMSILCSSNLNNIAGQKVKNMQTISKLTEIHLNGKNANPGSTELVENPTKTSDPRQQLSRVSSNSGLALIDNPDGQEEIAKEIHARFHAMKTYGKEPESLASITSTMLKDLIEFPAEKILLAFKTHAQRNEEFPITAALINLIKRNGKPPLKESDIIAIRKKDGEDRTRAEWDMLREWDSQQQEGWQEYADPQKDAANLAETIRLRQELMDAKAESRRLADLLHEERMRKGIEKPKPSLNEKINRTVEEMRKSGATQEAIDEFLSQYSLQNAA